MEIIAVILFVSFFAIIAGGLIAKNLIYVCGPNEVLVFSGGRHLALEDVNGQKRKVARGYRLIRGGRGLRIPLFETVDQLDLTNISIEVSVNNAYARGGIPLSVTGVANVKIASQSPTLNNAIERFLGKTRKEIIKIAKETLEGNLRGVLSQLTPEQDNEDKTSFVQQMMHEAGEDLARLGLNLDNLQIQNISDERGFLDSIGRIQSAELIKRARVAEAQAHSLANIRDAENTQNSRLEEIKNEMDTVRAEADRKIRDAITRKDALVAEERGRVEALITKAKADLDVQRARIEEVRKRLEADVIAPAQAGMKADQAEAVGKAAKILEDGRATTAVLNEMITTWQNGGQNARDIFLMQKLQSVMGALLDSIEDVQVDRITILPEGNNSRASQAVGLVEELKAAIGVDIPAIANRLGQPTDTN
ncbi:MAG: SPFH domain-containing protein [Myxococcota bacterium]|nr:SPFH domain-containing protein [Myxococcota bacterium]